MTILQQAITIILCALGTMLTRFLPFLVFTPKKADAQVHPIPRLSTAGRDLRHARRLLPAQC